MSEFQYSPPEITKLEIQPSFPSEDLTDKNTELIRHALSHDFGLDIHANRLTKDHSHLYATTVRALELINVRIKPGPNTLHSFSHGFAGLEVISDMVHPTTRPSLVTGVAVERVANSLIDTRPGDEIEFEHMAQFDSDQNLPDNMITDGVRPRFMKHDDDIVDLPPTLANFLIRRHKEETIVPNRDLADAPKKIAEHYTQVTQEYPNVVDVMTEIGNARSETIPELTSRLAGMSIAHSLQVRD